MRACVRVIALCVFAYRALGLTPIVNASIMTSRPWTITFSPMAKWTWYLSPAVIFAVFWLVSIDLQFAPSVGRMLFLPCVFFILSFVNTGSGQMIMELFYLAGPCILYCPPHIFYSPCTAPDKLY